MGNGERSTDILGKHIPQLWRLQAGAREALGEDSVRNIRHALSGAHPRCGAFSDSKPVGLSILPRIDIRSGSQFHSNAL